MQKMTGMIGTAAGALIVLTTFAMPALAEQEGPDNAAEAQQFMAAKLSLTDAVKAAEADSGGKAMDVTFAEEMGTWVYEVELIKPDATIIEVTVDSASGKVAVKPAEGNDDDQDGDASEADNG